MAQNSRDELDKSSRSLLSKISQQTKTVQINITHTEGLKTSFEKRKSIIKTANSSGRTSGAGGYAASEKSRMNLTSNSIRAQK